MKVTRKMLLIITASLGVFIIVYSLVRQFFGIGLSDSMERYMMDVIIISALGLFMYNRKMAKDEQREREEARKAEEEAERRLEGEDESVEDSQDDEDLPHWERKKRITDVNADSDSNEDER